MNIESKRNELSNWIRNIDEDMLLRIDSLKKSLTNEIVIYTANGKGLTKSQYLSYLEGISKKVKNNKKTFTSMEVKNFVLNRK